MICYLSLWSQYVYWQNHIAAKFLLQLLFLVLVHKLNVLIFLNYEYIIQLLALTATIYGNIWLNNLDNSSSMELHVNPPSLYVLMCNTL